MRLSSGAFPADQMVHVRTRSETVVEPGGDDAEERDGRTPATAFRSLRRAVETVRAGETIRLLPGRYLEGEIEVYLLSSGIGEATASDPIAIVGEALGTVILDGTDPDFAPRWEGYDEAAGLYRTATDREPYHAYLNGGRLYRYGLLEVLRTNRWEQGSGFFADGRHLYVRVPGGRPPGTNRITLSRFNFALSMAVNHFRLRNLEFCYYGYGREPAALSLDNASSNLVEDCTFHHTGMGVVIRHDSAHHTIQRCSFSEWPVEAFSWDAIKQGEPFGSEPYESGGISVYGEHTAGGSPGTSSVPTVSTACSTAPT